MVGCGRFTAVAIDITSLAPVPSTIILAMNRLPAGKGAQPGAAAEARILGEFRDLPAMRPAT